MKLSIITINRNNREGLLATLDSVLGQTARAEFEYIVVDGASSDGSVEEIGQRSSKIDKWVSERDSGVYNAMNKGVAMSSGDYCLFLNSGDILHNYNTVSSVLPYLKGEDILSGKMVFTKNNIQMYADEPLTLGFFFQRSLPHPATFIRTSLLKQTPYDESLRIVSDWKFFLQVIIQQNASYRFLDLLIADFAPAGLSAQNRELAQQERSLVLNSMFSDRILLDYIQQFQGKGYQNGDYDYFFVTLRKYSIRRFVYTADVMLLRLAGFFKKNLRWVRKYPLHLGKQ